jgi:hypothetical protein
MRRILCLAVCIFGSVAVWAQAQRPVPIPVPGGDILPPLINVFTNGVGPGFDGLNAEPHVITNFDGVVAMGYTLGSATDKTGKAYQVITDIRVYQGDYIGAQSTFAAGGTTSAMKAHGTFVLI